MSQSRPVWRSLLYVPVHVEKFVVSAHTRGSDAVILDLEDAVPWEHKARARGLVAEAARRVGQAGADVLVRVNGLEDLLWDDIEAVVGPRIAALSLPKVESVEQIRRIDDTLSRVEAERGMAPGQTRLLLIIESALGLLNMVALASASPRVVGLSLGGEDFALDLGMESADDTLFAPKQQVVIAAAAAGVMPLGLMGGATRFDDPDGYRALAIRSRRFGYQGSSCIHPNQVAILNEAFGPSAEEVAHAQRVIAGAEAAEKEGRGAFSLEGKMIDAPIVRRAEQVLARQAAIAGRGSKAA